MRVVGGTHRGRILQGPKGLATRPITDRVKVNLFNILRDRVEDAVVADCFCGTGSLGVEALSRGARWVSFAEIDGTALRLLKENLAALDLLDRSAVLRHDVLNKGLPPCPEGPGAGENSELGTRSSESRTGNSEPGGRKEPAGSGGRSEFRVPRSELSGAAARYTLVFLDPPYELTETAAGRLWLRLTEAARAGSLAPDALAVWRHESRVQLLPPPEAAGALRISDRRSYGSQALTFVERCSQNCAPGPAIE